VPEPEPLHTTKSGGVKPYSVIIFDYKEAYLQGLLSSVEHERTFWCVLIEVSEESISKAAKRNGAAQAKRTRLRYLKVGDLIWFQRI
jgi:hypothetical protein